MSRQSKLGGIILGDGSPKICVPVTGKSVRDILSEFRHVLSTEPDLIEWRADFFEQVTVTDSVLHVLKEIRVISPSLPIIFTLRDRSEGGAQAICRDMRLSIMQAVMASGLVTLLDTELASDPAFRASVAQTGKTHGIGIIFSYHDFQKTPGQDEILAHLSSAYEAGADVAKIAVMPTCPEDVLTLMSASLVAARTLNIPFIAISMSQLGFLSRIAAGLIGSCITFAAGSTSSAPGQPSIADLRQVLNKHQPLKQ